MKIKLTQGLANLDGTPLDIAISGCPVCGRPAESRSGTLRGVCADALVSQYEDERSLSGEEKVRRYNLALKITNEDVLDLSHADAALIQELVAKRYGPLVVGQVWGMLDPQEE